MRTLASLAAAFRSVHLEYVNKPPSFLPPYDANGTVDNLIRERSGSLPEDFPPELDGKFYEWLIPINVQMIRRANEQQKWNINPRLQTEIFVSIVNNQLPTRSRIDPNTTRIVWGLLCFGVVVTPNDYKKLTSEFTNFDVMGLESKGVVTNRFRGDLGSIPIIKSGVDTTDTLMHEDLHILQDIFGLLDTPFSFEGLFEDNSAIERSFLQSGIQPGDLERCKSFLENVAKKAEYEIDIEFHTTAWEKTTPHSTVMDAKRSDMIFAMNAMYNAIFDPTSNLDDEQKMWETFHVQYRFNKINMRRSTMFQILREARLRYKGPLNSTHFVGALSLLIPPGTSLRTIEAVMLGGKNEKLNKPLDRIIEADLAGAIALFARRKVSPESYGVGDNVSEERINQFLSLVVSIFNERKLIERIIESEKITPGELERTRNKLIEYARKSVPAGSRGKAAQTLKLNLRAYHNS